MNIKIVVVLLTLLTSSTIRTINLETLSGLRKHASKLPVDPKRDNLNWDNPAFIYFYNQHFNLPVYKKILIKLGIMEDPRVDIDSFKELLIKVTKDRKSKGYEGTNQTITFDKGPDIVIFGPLYGSFHSLIRGLTHLEKKGIINELEIITDNTYFVFLGNLINRSPYSIDLLHTLLLLIKKNPDKVICLRGEQETNRYWESFDTRRELLFRTGLWFEGVSYTPLGKEINDFFATLPTKLAFEDSNTKEKVVCATDYTNKEIISPNIKIIFGPEKFDYTKKLIGASFIGYLCGAAQWSIFSAPNKIHQDIFSFYYDAFVKLSIGPSISESVLTLYNNDIRTKTAFSHTYFEPIFGYKLPTNRSDIAGKTIISVGSTMALTGITGTYDRETKEGFNLALQSFNIAKNQNLIKPIFLNDSYIPLQALKNVETLYRDYKIDKLIIPAGTPTLQLYIDKVKSGQIAVFFPQTGSPQFRKPDLKNLINFIPSNGQEVKVLIDYLVKNEGITHFAFFYQDDEFGKPLVSVAEQQLKKYGIETWLDLPYQRAQKEFGPLITKLKNEAPSAIGLFSLYLPTRELINQLGPKFLFKRKIFGLSELLDRPFKIFLQELGLHYTTPKSVTNPQSNIAIAQEYRQAIKKTGLSPNTNSFTGYIVGSLFIDAINHLKAPFTKEKILGYFEKLKEYTFKGLTLTFNPEKRDLSQNVWISQ